MEKTNDPNELQRLQNRLLVIDNSHEDVDGDNWGDLYFLWSLERMAVIYDLKKIGEVDWHQWGTDIILEHRRKEVGDWRRAFPACRTLASPCCSCGGPTSPRI